MATEHPIPQEPQILSGDDRSLPALPMKQARRMDHSPERTLYVAQPGLRALPSGTLVIIGFASPQLLSVVFLFWAIWWPAPVTPGALRFALASTFLLGGLSLLVLWLLLRHNLALAAGIIRAPFTRVTVTTRRVLWTVPWSRHPVMEIGARRIAGGILGPTDKRGTGSAAMILRENDPSADFDGNIHFDRMPDAAGFVAALDGFH
ncbi:hypothetical protein [Sphingomonas prati]|uniref:Uncharacterized protein n=1 Tax=Sphingomonas prati TaxID=1843237 RepID=A0A7W9BSW5_9SPHN|nr:hypothetical protein [Sphingomonas prati]MBB5728993.1 hypothetical protein [Sphingomonas prati]GGE85917.1 hypothetical protein GCM10011404_18390 [Sphingomonas prati]